jgi:alpha-glucosidase (family GH31 glycosyl hydrolase)
VATSVTPTIWKIEYNPYPSESKQHKSFAVLDLPESSHKIVSSTENQRTTLKTTEGDSLQLQIEADSFSFLHKGTQVLKHWSFHNNVKREYQEPALDQTVTKEKIATEIHFEVHNDSHIYGLGEKTGLALDKKGRMWTMWNTDAWAYHSQTDALYQSIPFAIISTPTDQGILFHGIFVENTARQ